MEERCPSGPQNDNRDCPHCFAEWEKVGETPLQWRPLLFLLRQFWELTHFVLKITFFLLPFFSIEISTENVIELHFSVFSFGKVLINVNIINILTYNKDLKFINLYIIKNSSFRSVFRHN